MLVHIPCNDQRCAFHILEHMHHIRRHIDCRTALQTGCPLTSMLQMSNKQLHILYWFEHSLPSSWHLALWGQMRHTTHKLLRIPCRHLCSFAILDFGVFQ
jgi:hypothetical protein